MRDEVSRISLANQFAWTILCLKPKKRFSNKLNLHPILKIISLSQVPIPVTKFKQLLKSTINTLILFSKSTFLTRCHEVVKFPMTALIQIGSRTATNLSKMNEWMTAFLYTLNRIIIETKLLLIWRIGLSNVLKGA